MNLRQELIDFHNVRGGIALASLNAFRKTDPNDPRCKELEGIVNFHTAAVEYLQTCPETPETE